nr:solute carrier family 23 member 2-like isoform X2 [Ciona intestinalis]|eukprot:XP_026693018.1 solute carrier family 23 member 2-like isoform X2 [Ciona intestinalis]
MGKKDKEDEANESTGAHHLMYGLNDVPPWYLCITFGLQHLLLSVGGIVGMPLLLAPKLCMGNDDIGNQGRAYVIGTLFVVSGISTIIQTTFGNRLPILQGSSFAFFAPILSSLALPHNKCPDPLPPGSFNSTTTLYNDTDGSIVDGEELWMRRVRETQGSMAVAALFEVILGMTGTVGLMMRLIGPVTIAPTIALIGLDLFASAPFHASTNWATAIFTSTALIVSSQYLSHIKVPFFSFNRKRKCHVIWVPAFKMFPVLIALICGWTLCWILTATDYLSPDPADHSYYARADIRIAVIHNSPWFRVPYPGQWGAPRVVLSGVIGMLGGVLGSTIESIGDYYACAKLTESPPPPKHSINRGIMMEGMGCVLAGLFGTTTGTTSFSENIAAIGVTRVGSRRVLQTAGALFIIMGCVSKVGSIFVTLPEPVMGGIFLIMFGMIAAVGLSNLQYVDMNSPRNVFAVGFTLYMGLAIPEWVKGNTNAINTGSPLFNEVFTVLLSSPMLVSAILAGVLDNTLPGTREERGFTKWENSVASDFSDNTDQDDYSKVCYNLPFSTNCRLAKYLPFLPEFDDRVRRKREQELEEQTRRTEMGLRELGVEMNLLPSSVV